MKSLKIVMTVCLVACVSFFFVACGSGGKNNNNGGYNPANWERGTVHGSYTLGELYNMAKDAPDSSYDTGLGGKYIEVEFTLRTWGIHGDYYARFEGIYSDGSGWTLADVICYVYKPHYEFDFKGGDVLIATGYLQKNSGSGYTFRLNPCDIRKK